MAKQRKNSWKLLVNMHRNTLMKFLLLLMQNIFHVEEFLAGNPETSDEFLTHYNLDGTLIIFQRKL